MKGWSVCSLVYTRTTWAHLVNQLIVFQLLCQRYEGTSGKHLSPWLDGRITSQDPLSLWPTWRFESVDHCRSVYIFGHSPIAKRSLHIMASVGTWIFLITSIPRTPLTYRILGSCCIGFKGKSESLRNRRGPTTDGLSCHSIQSLIQRSYRDDVSPTYIERFMPLILEMEEENVTITPCFSSEGINYMHIRHNNLYCECNRECFSCNV